MAFFFLLFFFVGSVSNSSKKGHPWSEKLAILSLHLVPYDIQISSFCVAVKTEAPPFFLYMLYFNLIMVIQIFWVSLERAFLVSLFCTRGRQATGTVLRVREN